MKNYKELLMKKYTTGASVIDSQTQWGIVCKKFPFEPISEAKDLPSKSWHDEDGDDEFIPNVIPMKAYEVDVEFICVAPNGQAGVKIQSFLNYLTGRDTPSTGSKLQIYDTHTKIGRGDIRFVGYKNDAFMLPSSGEDVVVFTITFKINDPVTQITLSNG